MASATEAGIQKAEVKTERQRSEVVLEGRRSLTEPEVRSERSGVPRWQMVDYRPRWSWRDEGARRSAQMVGVQLSQLWTFVFAFICFHSFTYAPLCNQCMEYRLMWGKGSFKAV